MKSLYVTFTDAEYQKLYKAKRKSKYSNWHNFILFNCSKGISTKREINKNGNTNKNDN